MTISLLTHVINVHIIIDIAEQICYVVKHAEDGLNVDSNKHFSKFRVINKYNVIYDHQIGFRQKSINSTSNRHAYRQKNKVSRWWIHCDFYLH